MKAELIPKIRWVQKKMIRCGDPNCTKCPHGPYWYGYWKEAGVLKSTYIGKELPPYLQYLVRPVVH